MKGACTWGDLKSEASFDQFMRRPVVGRLVDAQLQRQLCEKYSGRSLQKTPEEDKQAIKSRIPKKPDMGRRSLKG